MSWPELPTFSPSTLLAQWAHFFICPAVFMRVPSPFVLHETLLSLQTWVLGADFFRGPSLPPLPRQLAGKVGKGIRLQTVVLSLSCPLFCTGWLVACSILSAACFLSRPPHLPLSLTPRLSTPSLLHFFCHQQSQDLYLPSDSLVIVACGHHLSSINPLSTLDLNSWVCWILFVFWMPCWYLKQLCADCIPVSLCSWISS